MLAFTNYLKKGNYAEAYSYFDKSITDKVTVRNLEGVWTATKVKLGEFIGTKSSVAEVKDSIETIIVTGQFDSGDLDIKFIFNPKHKIIGFFFTTPKNIISPYTTGL